ncbi:hypothetical protein RvY_12264 [Ramazzottius varieornatus]|uniref:CFAP65-like ninth Ig-like domain-containing protein n=1 Tax=Ramazzottius varieornatus TaxID=947166 RepID=A0A1D1VN45_RAMVA|nr:hypothetical protein RvY_12264 [Ramazzottius varieornatus]
MSREDDVFDLPASTHEDVNLTFWAEHCSTSQYHLYSEALSSHPSMQVKRIGTIKLQVSQPICQVVDLVGSGSMRVYGKERLWRLLHISQLNNLLALPADDQQDLLSNVLSYKGRTVLQIKCSSQVDISLGAAVLGQAGTVRLALHNDRGPVCHWKVVHLTDLEIKVKEISPISQLPEEYLILRKKKLISISPSHGSISEGSTSTIELQCSHAQVGEFLLPFFLQIDKGKLILIRASCQTLAPTQAGLVICRNELRFFPSPLSSKNVRIEMCEMYNPTLHKINFQATLNRHNKTSGESDYAQGTNKDKTHQELHQVQDDVFHILNWKGQIGPQSFAVIAFTFKPQHLTFSERHCTIKIHNEREYVVRLCGKGCSLKHFVKTAPTVEPSIQPVVDWLLPETNMLQISTTQLDFGFAPLFSLNQRVIFVQNVCKEAIRFRWHDVPEAQTSIDVLSWDAHNESSHFTHTFALHFTQDAAMASYLNWLHTWMAQVRERCLNFTITEENPTAAQDIRTAFEYIEALHPNPCPALPNTKSKTDGLSSGTPLSYPSPTLPAGPFTGSYPCPAPSSKPSATSLQADPLSPVFQHLLSLLQSRPDVKVPPLQPEPPIHRIHFSVAGHSIERSHFAKAFPNKSANFFFRSDERRDLPADKPAIVSPQYSAIATGYLSKVVHSILNENFKDDVQEVLNVSHSLYYADMLEKSTADAKLMGEEAELDSVGNYDEGGEDSRKNRTATRPKRSEDDEEPTAIYAVSPRVTLNRQANQEAAGDQENTRRHELTKPTLSQLLDCAENQEEAMKVIQSHHNSQSHVLGSTIYQLVARDLFHDIIASVLKDCRNYTFSLFEKPRLQLEDSQLDKTATSL